MNFAINGEHIKKATQDITKRLDGFKYEEALEVLDRVAFQLKANATISIPSKESNADNKENAVLKRQLEEQRSDLLEFAQAARKAYGIMDSNLIAIENYLQSEDARDCYHGMLLAQKEDDKLANDSTSDGAVPLQ